MNHVSLAEALRQRAGSAHSARRAQVMASTSTSSSAPGTHKRDTSTVVMVGGVPVKRAARTLPYSGSWPRSVRKVRYDHVPQGWHRERPESL